MGHSRRDSQMTLDDYTSLRRFFAFFGVNEFYQKGCQEKSSASTGDEMFSRDPAHWNEASLEKFDLCPF